MARARTGRFPKLDKVPALLHPPWTMDLNEAETFVRVVETGGMTPAAKLLGVPRSTVSRRIARLEEALGVQLLKRTTRRVNLTEEGRAFFQRVQPALASAREAAAVVKDLADEPRGVLRVSSLVDFSLSVLGPLVARFADEHPELRIDMHIDNRSVDLVGEGFDCALRAGPMPDSSLVARTIARFDMTLFASPAYLEAHGTPTSVADLEDHAFVLFRAPEGRKQLALVGPGGEQVQVPIEGPVTTDDFGFVQRLVRAGAGIGLMPAFLGMAPRQRGELVALLDGWAFSGADIRFVTPAGRYVPAKVRAFRDFLIEELGKLDSERSNTAAHRSAA
jgi:DNA-binding transcriptional LysR family regulator